MKFEIGLSGQWSVERRCRETGKLIGIESGRKNAILDSGIHTALDLWFGIGPPSSSDQLTNGRTQLLVYEDPDYVTPVKSLSCKSGYPTSVSGSPNPSVEYWWEDISTSIYTPDRLVVRNTTTGDLFSQRDAPGFGEKPDTENWTYKYTLTLSRGADTDFDPGGLSHCLRLITGEETWTLANCWSGGGGQARLYVEASGGSPSATIAPESGYPQRTDETVTILFQAGTSTANISWYDVSVQGILSGPGGNVVLSKTNESIPAKISNVVRNYTYELTLSSS